VPAKKGGHGVASGPMSPTKTAVLFGGGALLFLLIGRFAPPSFLGHFTVFVLACFVGYMVVWNVKPALHTPLMSVTNAVSSIIAIGALVQIAPDLTKISADLSRPNEWIRWLSVAAIALATINMFGGFAVTQRMLSMFRK
jgi:NAD(P) transhydrogenase subunit alpha